MRTDREPRAEMRSLVHEVSRAFTLGSLISVDALGGTAAKSWAVTTDRGRYVVRVRPQEFARTVGVRGHHALLLRLAAAGLPVPRPLQTATGETLLRWEDQTIEVLTWIEGETWSRVIPGRVFGLGAFLARFHRALASEVSGSNPTAQREDHPDALQAVLDTLIAQTADPDQIQQLARIGKLLEQGRQELETTLYPSLPRAVIHGDIHPGNVRFSGPDVAALYDFDYLAIQARVRDLVDALIFFASYRCRLFDPDDIRSLTQPFIPDPDLARELFRGYQSISPLKENEWRALPLLMRSRWIQMRLRGQRKVPDSKRTEFVLHKFENVPDWISKSGPAFFRQLQAEPTRF